MAKIYHFRIFIYFISVVCVLAVDEKMVLQITFEKEYFDETFSGDTVRNVPLFSLAVSSQWPL